MKWTFKILIVSAVINCIQTCEHIHYKEQKEQEIKQIKFINHLLKIKIKKKDGTKQPTKKHKTSRGIEISTRFHV